jgi:hypothetical protein
MAKHPAQAQAGEPTGSLNKHGQQESGFASLDDQRDR